MNNTGTKYVRIMKEIGLPDSDPICESAAVDTSYNYRTGSLVRISMTETDFICESACVCLFSLGITLRKWAYSIENLMALY